MRRHPSRLLRCSRALIGLVTLWCLGCSGYETLLGSMLGASAGVGMNCASGATMADDPAVDRHVVDRTDAGDADMSVGSSSDRAGLTVSAPADARGFDCGCGGSCHAPSPALVAVAAPVSPVPAVEPSPPSEPASVSRKPLLPPPELTA